MKCKYCGKDIFKHSLSDVKDCLGEAGFDVEVQHPFQLISQTRVHVSVNYRHNIIVVEGKEFESKDVDTDLYRVALLGDSVKPKKVKRSQEEIKDELDRRIEAEYDTEPLEDEENER